MMRQLHIVVSWLGIASGGIACANLAALIAWIDGPASIALIFIGLIVGSWLGWIASGSPTLLLAIGPIFQAGPHATNEGHSGTSRGARCAIGAVRCLGHAKPETIWHGGGHRLILGAGRAADDAFLSAASSWPEALVFVDTRGASTRLARADAVRFAPGSVDGVRLNPLLDLRRGPHAWRDAIILASGLVGAKTGGEARGQIVTALATVLLDHLHTAPLAARTLDHVRQRLLDPVRVFAEITNAVHESDGGGAWHAHAEIARMARAWIADSETAIARLREAERALRLLQDGRLVEATSALELRLADCASIGALTIIVEAPPGEAARYGPFFAGLLGQLVAALTDAVETDAWGRKKTRRVLLAIDDAAALSSIPLLAQRAQAAPRCGLEVLVRANDLEEAGMVFGDAGGAFDAIVAVGPQSLKSAASLGAHIGNSDAVRLRRARGDGMLARLVPVFEGTRIPTLAPAALTRVPQHAAYILCRDQKPIYGAPIVLADEAPRLRMRQVPLPPVAHDWTGEPAPKLATTLAPPTAPAALIEHRKSDSAARRLRAGLSRGAKGQ
jgi:type IV secretory pathway TraG/TraD family ATPase VirD4